MQSCLINLLSEKEDDNFFLRTQGVVPLKSEFKPTMKVLSRKPATKTPTTVEGVGHLTLEDDDEDEDASKDLLTPEQRQQKAQREREEKQKAYEERRKELFGKDHSGGGSSSSGRKNGSPRNQSKVKGVNESRPSSAASNKSRQLYDPNESTKPEHLRMQKKEFQLGENHPIREPKAPTNNGRGGFGFASRGGR